MREYVSKEEADNYLLMLGSKDMILVEFALDFILATNLYLPYRYNEVVGHVRGNPLREALDGIGTHSSGQRLWLRKELRKKINRVRAKHTYGNRSKTSHSQ